MSLAAASARAQTAEQILIKGDPPKRWIESDDLGFYYQIPTEWRLRAAVTGPGTLIMFLINHRSEVARATSTLVVTLDEKPWKRLKLGCGPTKRRFTTGRRIIPCARLTRDLQIPAGVHQLGFKLSRTRWGASMHMLFVAQAVLDAEPDLVATTVGGKTEAEAEVAEWQPASDADLGASASVAIDPGALGSGVEQAAGPRRLVLALVGVAVASASAGAYFGVRSRTKFAKADEENEKQRRQTKIDKLNRAGKRNAIIANALFGVAALSLGGAALVFVMQPDGGSDASSGEVETGATYGFALRFDL